MRGRFYLREDREGSPLAARVGTLPLPGWFWENRSVIHVRLFEILVVDRPFSADVLGTDPGSQYHGLTHSVLLQTDGHCHLFQMHADQCAANVQASIRPDQ